MNVGMQCEVLCGVCTGQPRLGHCILHAAIGLRVRLQASPWPEPGDKIQNQLDQARVHDSGREASRDTLDLNDYISP